MENFRNDMESMHLDKVRELKEREENAMTRISTKEREVEKAAYSHRQLVLKDEETMRYRENDVKKTVEMELVLIKNEKDKMAHTIKEYELKLAEMENFKLKLGKQQIEDLERFKSEYQRKFKDDDFEIHRRRLAIDEDEHRVKLEKDRVLRTTINYESNAKELDKFKGEYQILTKEHREV